MKDLFSEIILEATHIKKYFPIQRGLLLKTVGHVKAVDDVSLQIFKGETLGLVGESGCGKSTLGRTLIRLHEPTSGNLQFEGFNFLTVHGRKLRVLRKDIQMIFQDPYASLDPRMTIGQIIRQPFDIHSVGTSSSRNGKVKELLELVGLKASHVNRYPHEFSGGQRQRICIARAIALNPKLIICDEPVSALDVSIQAQILNLLKDLQEKLGLTYLFISHDLSVIEYFCNRVAVMYLGKIVEIGTRDEIFNQPKHPYTQALLAAIPRVGEGKKVQRKSLSGEVPSPINPPSGCSFHPRCPQAMEHCSTNVPVLKGDLSHNVACYLYDNDEVDVNPKKKSEKKKGT